MRNLKRALSLALASVMVLGMMVVGAGAASYDEFSDKDKIVNAEAVSILNTLNVINGKDDGSFDPTGIVTRAEMAKMICVILNGGSDPNLGTSATTSYTDTAGTWAAGYIEFCTNQKIVGGDGTGKFNPTATVTGQEAAKMILVAMGYDATFETMTGAAWATSVNVLANKNGLYDGLTINPSVGLSRDNAAQMIYNALDAEMVYYDYAIIPSNGTLDSIATAKTYEKSTTILTEHFKAVKVEGIVVGNEAANLTMNTAVDSFGTKPIGSARDTGKTRIDVTNGPTNNAGNNGDQNAYNNGEQTFSVASGAEVLGRKVEFYVKPANNGNSERSTVIGGLILSSDNKVVTDYSDAKHSKILDDNDLDAASSITVYKNYVEGTEVTNTTANNNALTALLDQKGESGVERIYIDNNGDDEVEIVLVNYTFLGKVTRYSTREDGEIRVQAGSYSVSTDDSANVVGFEDVAKDDIVLVTSYGGKIYVTEPETIEGDVDSYRGDDAAITSLTVDGTRYDTTYSSILVTSDLNGVYVSDADDVADLTATFYLDAQGKIIAYGEGETTAANYAVVVGLATPGQGNTLDSDRVKVVLQDGTTATYYVASNSALKPSEGDLTLGQLVSYSINSNDDIRMTSPRVGGTATDNAKFTKGRTSITGTGIGSSLYATSSTLFFYIGTKTENGAQVDDFDKVSVYNGYANAPTITDGTATVAVNSNGRVTAVVFGKTATEANVSDHMFVYGFGDRNSDTVVANVIMAGSDETESVTVNRADSSSADGNFSMNSNLADLDDKIYVFTTNSSQEYVLEDPDPSRIVTANVTNSSRNSVAVSAGEYEVTSETVIVDNTTSTPTATIGSVSVSTGDNVTILFNGDGEALMVVINSYAA